MVMAADKQKNNHKGWQNEREKREKEKTDTLGCKQWDEYWRLLLAAEDDVLICQ